MDDKTKKTYSDLFRGIPDIYKIIGVTDKDSHEIINKKCIEKLKKYQPSRHVELVKKFPVEERPRQLKKLSIQYDLISQASNILRDAKKRKFYDLQKKTVDNKNFVVQKQSFETFKKLQDSKINEKTKKLAKHEFDMQFLELDKKRGFKREELNEKPLNIEETQRRFDDLEMSREQDLAEYIPENKFEDRVFDTNEFNKNFAIYKKKQEKKRGGKGGDKSILKWDGIMAANDFGMTGGSDYIPIDNMEDLFADDNFNDTSIFASKMSDSEEGSNFGSDFDENDVDFDLYDAHDKNKEKTFMSYEERLKERQMENLAFDARVVNDKKSWKSVFDNPMNISSTMGDVMLGKDLQQLDSLKQTNKINKEYAEVYKQLVYDEHKKTKKSTNSNKK